MNYRRLTLQELESLEQEFVYFLIANGIPADHWEKIKTADTDKMNALLDEFSDLVFQTSVEKAEYLLHINSGELTLFHCKPDEIQFYSITSSHSEIDLTAFDSFDKLIEHLETDQNMQKVNFCSPYRPDRAKTIFQLMESGCGISDRHTFEQVTSLFK